MVTEIFIEGNRIDINADLASLLTFAIDDIKDFSSRSTTFSKTIVIPGTSRNNAVFGNIFETGISNDYDPLLNNIGYNFNASKSARCLMFQDNIQTFKGTVRLLEIDKYQGTIEYEIALNGELTGLNVALSSGLLEDLDFSAYNHLYNTANIIASWDNPGGSGYYYPMADYGTYSVNKHDWKIGTFRPALYVKEYIDKMFEAAGYRYEAPLFSTTRFLRLVVPHNQKILQALNTLLLTANREADLVVLTSAGIGNTMFKFENVDSSIFTWDALKTRFTYTGATVGSHFYFNFRGQRRATSTSYTLKLLKNGVEVPAVTLNIPYAPVSPATFLPFSWERDVDITVNPGDYFEFNFVANLSGTDTNYELDVIDAQLEITSNTGNVLTPVMLGDEVQINVGIPKNIRQVDFLVSVVKLFNLYVYEKPFDDKKIFIAPFVDFYSLESQNAVDWTYKMNRDEAIKIKPLSEVNSKIYNFKYKDDNDYYNELYKKRYNSTYGSHIFDSQFEFATQTSNLELIFAGTPLVGYGGEEKVYPTIFKRTGPDTAPVEENVDSVIRILQTKKISGVTSWNILDGVLPNPVLASITDYGYAGHFDDPDNPDNDINFGVLQELFFILTVGDLTKTQFNLYWSSYMAEITDKDSKMLTAKFYLTARDIFELDFSKYVVVDGVLFRLNKITDYNVTIPSDCSVELLRVINTSYSFPPGTDPGLEEYFLLWSNGNDMDYNTANEIFYR